MLHQPLDNNDHDDPEPQYVGDGAHMRSAVPLGADERGVAEVSERLYTKVTRYHAQIGHNVPKEMLSDLESNLLTEAKELFHHGEYEQALNTFTHCLAVTEKTRAARDHAVRGAIVHNIASCLHLLGEMEAAQEYYEQAIEAFKKAKSPMIDRFIYGDANKKRVDFVKERLIDISWGRKPDVDKYLDENGNKRPVPPPDRERAQQALSRRWGVEEPPPPPWAEEQERESMADYPYARRPAWLAASAAHADDADGGARAGGGARRADACRCDYRPDKGALGSDQHTKELHEEAALAAARRAEGRREEDARVVGGAEEEAAAELDDEAQEQARKEWLQYYLQMGEWDKAAELVVTAGEMEDLEYLQEREHRLSKYSCK